jgi:hypothetical protein
MLNITPATAAAATAQPADACASQAATRPLAGFGAGAFTREAAWAGTRTSEFAASQALPRIKPAIGAPGTGSAMSMTSFVGSGQANTVQFSTAQFGIVHVDSVQGDTHNFIQMTRMYPVIQGGVGPHLAREPVPV